MRFFIYDTAGKVRDCTADCNLWQMQAMVSEFRTHCIVERKQYEFNHFVNWANKYKNIQIKYTDLTDGQRVDM